MNKTDFEWHEAKNKENLLKHGVSFEDAFYDESLLIALDEKIVQSLSKGIFALAWIRIKQAF
ncbi:hypothetical protein ACFO4O_12395 [Glaciecola siphonariae]|uniref:BrnT family toxin n=1 Tax=Glaciecola siphonariae TaxID=521012 RepID=A0ABV9LYS3_9ALTE